MSDLAAMGKGKGQAVTPAQNAQGLARLTQEKRSKYRNERTAIGTEVFDSRREADYWLLLKAREQAGEITDLARQVKFALWCPIMEADGTRLKSLADGQPGFVVVATYIADFTFRDPLIEPHAADAKGRLHVIDAKGRRISPYPLKKKWLEFQQGIFIEEV